eukprot:CAMPEP_0172572876 /NCGR_PEP_ID=MMETSP1067-20121228/135905_1 /TAXON_ID=265564 ORGANISM="Thalassiosira punctigera, Strain Tpunct2005C2" /NCGR_SAMPLE_ID=MMETSP1067 /ASSEMBLY_ACC=CAM_ASM_000444 /LENGTH=156 /DNA_ID=CAMNT_0013365467 /DNA_START=972 /DNA_END=1442 /DNA_ORIENTATION=-
MNTISILVLFASAMYTSVSEALEREDPYGYVSILKAKEEAQVVVDAIWREEHREELSTDGCDDQTEGLATCFDYVKETNGEGCWDCVMPENVPDTCDEYCKQVEQCRSDTCQSGHACLTQYYEVLNCIMGFMESTEDCHCDQSVHVAPKKYLRLRA